MSENYAVEVDPEQFEEYAEKRDDLEQNEEGWSYTGEENCSVNFVNFAGYDTDRAVFEGDRNDFRHVFGFNWTVVDRELEGVNSDVSSSDRSFDLRGSPYHSASGLQWDGYDDFLEQEEKEAQSDSQEVVADGGEIEDSWNYAGTTALGDERGADELVEGVQSSLTRGN